MGDVYEGSSGAPAENPDLIALGTVMSGLATALAMGGVARVTWLKDAGNYAVGSAADDLVSPIMLFGMLFLSGCYLGASAFWLAARRQSDIVPLRVAMGAAAGAALGFGVVLLIGLVLPVPPPLAAGLSVLAAYYGARLTTVLRRPKPADPRLRIARVTLVGTGLLVATALVSVRPHGFPGGEAPLAERDAWATKAFGEHYAEAKTHLQGCSGLAERVGAVKAIGPVSGPNKVYVGGDDSSGTFTLEVVGDKGAVRVKAHTRRPHAPKDGPRPFTRSAALLDGERTVPLECR
ncbi:MAG: hypothetical protein ACK46X_09810 [Candidatus Sericytochromatia bacterium]